MHKTIHASLILLVVLIAPRAFGGFVATVNVGAAMPSLEVGNLSEGGDAGFILGGSLGLRTRDLIQWDVVEGFFATADQSDALGSYTARNWGIGTGVRFGIFGGDSWIRPYASLGIGAGGTRIEAGGLSEEPETGFQWNVGVGFLLRPTEAGALGVRYRYHSSSVPSVLGIPLTDVNVNLHTITAEFLFGN